MLAGRDDTRTLLGQRTKGYSPLYYAVHLGRIDVADRLVRLGADPFDWHGPDVQPPTPWALAMQDQSPKGLEMLETLFVGFLDSSDNPFLHSGKFLYRRLSELEQEHVVRKSPAGDTVISEDSRRLLLRLEKRLADFGVHVGGCEGAPPASPANPGASPGELASTAAFRDSSTPPECTTNSTAELATATFEQNQPEASVSGHDEGPTTPPLTPASSPPRLTPRKPRPPGIR